MGLHISPKSFGEGNAKWLTYKRGPIINFGVKEKVILPSNKTIASCAWRCFGCSLSDLVFLVGYNGCAWSSSSHWKGVEKSSNKLEFQFEEQFLNICREWEFIKCHSEYLVHEIAKAQPGLWESWNVRPLFLESVSSTDRQFCPQLSFISHFLFFLFFPFSHYFQ